MSDRTFNLSRVRRLSAAEYQPTFDKGVSSAGRLFVLWVVSSKGGDAESPTKAGFVASKRTLRHAVDRNRARRLMREAFRLAYPRYRAGLRMIFLARAKIVGASLADVQAELLYLGKRGKIWQK